MHFERSLESYFISTGQATIKNLTPGQVYYFNIRAFDYSPRANEDNNRVWLKAMIK